MDDYKFSLKRLEGDLVELRMVMPSPTAQPEDLTGLEARKRIAQWVLSSASGMALSCNATEQTLKIFPFIYESVAGGLDHEAKFRPLIFREVAKRAVSPAELATQPPEGMTTREVERTVRIMIETNDLELDEQGTLRTPVPTTH